jgi:hypothetical protein
LKLKSAIALAYEQNVFWADVGGTKVGFLLASSPLATNSVKCTCGSRTWETTMTKAGDNNHLYVTLPAKSTYTDAVDDIMCAAGDITCDARVWSTSTAVITTDMTLSCFACQKSATTCTINDVLAGTGTDY